MPHIPPTPQRAAQGFFYGWVIAAGCWLVTLVNGGLFWTFGVFFKPLSTEFGWSRGELSLVNTAFLVAYAPGAILWGKIADRFGPRRVLWLASILVLLGYLGSSRIDSRMPLVFYYALIGLGTSATLGLPVVTVQRWFVKRRGLLLGIVASGPGIGSLIFAPLAADLIYSHEWRTAYVILGIILGCALALGASLMMRSPETKGLTAYGGVRATPAAASQSPGTGSKEPGTENEERGAARGVRTTPVASPIRVEDGFKAGQALRTRAFWGLAALHILSLMPTLFFTTHLVPLAIDRGNSAAVAAQALGLMGVMGVPGRILLGGAADRIGWMRGVAVANFVAAAATLSLALVGQPWMVFLFVVPFGFFNGGNLALLSGAVTMFFGIVALGEILGYALAISVLSGSASPVLGGWVFDTTGSYFLFLVFAAVCFAAGGVYSLMLKPPKRMT